MINTQNSFSYFGYFYMEIKILSCCIGCGACSQIAPEVFDIYSNYAVTNEYNIDNFQDECIDASIICPVDAIKVFI